MWFFNVFRDQHERIQALEEAGFANLETVENGSWSKVLLVHSLALLAHHSHLPEHFILRPLAGEAEVETYVHTHQTVFETKNMTPAWRQRTLQPPAYTPDLDIVVQAPSGRLAAFCIGWLRSTPDGVPVGQIVPLGCHPDFRRYALGRLALGEVLHWSVTSRSTLKSGIYDYDAIGRLQATQAPERQTGR